MLQNFLNFIFMKMFVRALNFLNSRRHSKKIKWITQVYFAK